MTDDPRLTLSLSPEALATIQELADRLRTHAMVIGQAAVEQGSVVQMGIADDCSHAARVIQAFLDFFEGTR